MTMIGNTLSHYRVTAKLGEGGMGEVYRAEDSRLGRDVALKVLPENLASDPDRLARFSREARMLASLSHGNIASIYDLVEADGRQLLVMEVAEGETLAEALERGPIPLDTACRIAVQIAEALEAAHEKGIVHRDLKPANIKVGPQGHVKVLDFGLAKALDQDPVVSDAPSPSVIQNSPTLTQQQVTQMGVLLGTAPYMSPEQARAQRVDRRADIWAFGCVLSEMLTGQRLFSGQSATDILGAIVHSEPNLDSLPPEVPPRLRRLIQQCLRKDANRRLQSIGDARVALQDYLEDPSSAALPATGATTTEPDWKRWLPWAAAAVLGAALALTLLARRPTDTLAPALRLEVRMGDRSFDRSLGSSVVLSRQGTHIAFVTGNGNESAVQVRALSEESATTLVNGQGSRSVYHPFFSDDGKWVGFATASELKKVSVTGGSEVHIVDVDRSRGASWGADDTIVYAPSTTSPLMRVSAAGGEPATLTALEGEEVSHRWPQVLPGGRAVLFTSHNRSTGFEGAQVEVLEVTSGVRTVLQRGGYYARYVQSGHILFVDRSTLFALPFDLETLTTTGTPVPVLNEISGGIGDGTGQYDVAENGILVYLSGSEEADIDHLVWADRRGALSELWEAPGSFGTPRLSPDGSRLSLASKRDEDWDVWVFDLERKVETRITFAQGYDADQVWSPDGAWIVFASDRGGKGNTRIFRKRADGAGEAELIEVELDSSVSWYPQYWSGNDLLVQSSNGDLWTVDLGSAPPTAAPIAATGFLEQFPAMSPNDRYLAFGSTESGRFEVYVIDRGERGGKWKISNDGGNQPLWSADGRQLFYRTDDGIMAVAVDTTGPSFRFDQAQPLFEAELSGGIQGRTAAGFVFPDYDVEGNGERFVMLRGIASESQEEGWIRLYTNWFSELERLAPPSRR